jgi:hypothetical protein
MGKTELSGGNGTVRERLLTDGMRRLLIVAGALVFLAGVQLFVLSEHTDRYFAWTIDVPLTAAFLGAGYWASVALEWLAAREATWARARIAVPAVFVFTVLTLVATLVHLDLFHLDGDNSLLTRTVTWAWLAIYVFVPLAMLVLIVTQLQRSGEDSPRGRPLPYWMRIVLSVQAAVLLGLGVALFVEPERSASLWPWALTPLTGRAVAAWLLGVAVAAVHTVWENDAHRVRVAFASYAALGVLQLVALVRFPDVVSFSGPKPWIYVLFLISLLVVGLYGWLVLRR